MKDEKPSDRISDLPPITEDGEEAEVYAVESIGNRWTLSRRDVFTAAGAAAAAAAAPSHAQAPVCTGIAHTQAITAMVISANGAFAYTTSADGRLKTWKLPEGAFVTSVTYSLTPTCMAINPAGTEVAIGLATGALRVIPVSGGTGVSRTGHTGAVNAVAYSPNGRFLASGGNDRNIYLSTTGGTRIKTDSNEIPSALAFTPDSEFLMIGYANGGFRLLSVPDFIPIPLPVTMRHDDSITALLVSWDGSILVSASRDNTVKLWSFPAGELLRTLTHPNDVTGAGIEGEALVTSCTDGSWREWSFPGGALRRTSPASSAVNLIVVGGGRVLTTTSGSMRLWELSTGRVLVECMIDLTVNPTSAQGTRYTSNGVTYTLPCGSPIPAGAICTCNCVSNCSCVSNVSCGCVSNTCSCVSNCGCVSNVVSHYWYPN